MVEDCEGEALRLIEELDLQEPVCPWELAVALDVRVRMGPAGCRPRIGKRGADWVTLLNPADRKPRQGARLVHEICHPLLRALGLPSDERHAWWLAAALLMPRWFFERLIRRHSTIDRVAAALPHLSQELVARRYVQIRDSYHLWVWDVEPDENRYRILSPGWRWRARHPHPLVNETMREAFASQEVVEIYGGVLAWPVNDGVYRRILCVADGSTLS